MKPWPNVLPMLMQRFGYTEHTHREVGLLIIAVGFRVAWLAQWPGANAKENEVWLSPEKCEVVTVTTDAEHFARMFIEQPMLEGKLNRSTVQLVCEELRQKSGNLFACVLLARPTNASVLQPTPTTTPTVNATNEPLMSSKQSSSSCASTSATPHANLFQPSPSGVLEQGALSDGLHDADAWLLDVDVSAEKIQSAATNHPDAKVVYDPQIVALNTKLQLSAGKSSSTRKQTKTDACSSERESAAPMRKRRCATGQAPPSRSSKKPCLGGTTPGQHTKQ